MSRIRLALGSWAVAALASSGFAQKDRGPADRFVAALAERQLPAEAAQMIRERWAACTDCDPEEFLTQALAVVSDDFRAALDAYDADDYIECAARMEELVKSEDPFIAVNAAAYQAKSLIAADRTLEAHQIIKSLNENSADRLTTYSYFAPEMSFLDGYCLLADLQYDAASVALNTFLAQHGAASPRLEIAAKQILLELANRQEGQIGEVVDLMQFSQRRLKNADAGESVQTRQKRILELLDAMIQEAEEQEQQQQASSSGSQQQQQGQQQNQGGQQPSNPMQDSSLPGGPGGEGNLREARRANPGETWGQLPPAERERILQALRDSFPSRYRQLVEQYYEELAKKP
jgi:hypothetical protein